MNALEDAVAICQRAGRRIVRVKTDNYVTATLNPGDQDFSERFTAGWLTNYLYQEAMLNSRNMRLGQPTNIFIVLGDAECVIHLRASIRPGHISALDWERV